MMKNLVLFSVIVILISCASLSSKEIDRVVIDRISSIDNPDWKTTTLNLKAGEKLWFWTDMNIEYMGDLDLVYQIQLIKNTDTVGFLELHPFEKNVTIGEVKTTLFGKTKWSFKGSMDFLQIKETAKYTFRTILASSKNESLIFGKADLVFKK